MSNERDKGVCVLETLRKEYESIEIPAQLSLRVSRAMRQAEEELRLEEEKGSKGEEMISKGEETISATEKGKEKMREESIRETRKRYKKVWGGVAAALALAVLGLGAGVNASPAFAASVDGIPVIGDLARVLTIKSVHEETDAYVADLEIPGIEGLENEELQEEINRLVSEQVDAAVEESKVMMEEYKEAYLATGGTEEDYIPREIFVDYEVKCISKDVLSFAVYQTESIASAYTELFYYNYDLNTSQALSLEDLLGPDYMEIANPQIAEEIALRSQIEGNMYFDGSEGVEGFSTIRSDQPFYVNEAGNAVIVFEKYEIAPGYMGIQEFEIIK
ncbi:MAG: DUF3298 and DUF4163 domain-containing protein [Bacillota bacterium]|nr:DUF3298 and DUF4163 domain-containing protein [Bacillota bacterium]